MSFDFIKSIISENKTRPEKLEIMPISYGRNDLAPAISKATIDYHYENLAKTYAKRYNAGEGDPDFNHAGVFLHNILFQQYKEPTSGNKPGGAVLEHIEKHFTSFDNFKVEFEKTAMSIQGSGWVYLAKDGTIKTIKNHEIKNDIVLLVDWWEHAWALDYQADKKDYLSNQWKIINWDHINVRNYL
jgi:Fe-Mn family superoxide dismutase